MRWQRIRSIGEALTRGSETSFCFTAPFWSSSQSLSLFISRLLSLCRFPPVIWDCLFSSLCRQSREEPWHLFQPSSHEPAQ